MEIKRDNYLNKLLRYRHNHLVKIVTGLRRSGKSYLIFQIFKQHLLQEGINENHIIEMAFDDFANRAYRNPERLYTYIKSRIKDDDMYYILLDEVQLLDDFVDVLNGFLHIQNADVYVTGSNAKFLSSDIVTEFRGRGVQIHVNPLSFREFMSVFHDDVRQGWQQYRLYGGLPMVVLAEGEQEKKEILNGLIKETYISDIINRNKIKNDSEVEDLFNILASNIGGLTNPAKLSNTFKSEKRVDISAATIKRYIDYFIDSFLIEKANRYDIKGKKYINTPLKYYFTDMGLRNSLLNFRQIEPTHLMENVIYNELRMQGYNVDVGVLTQYAKDSNAKTQRMQLEIDFVCNNGSERKYIQSAFSLPDKEKIEQEQRSLLLTNDAFAKTIITGDDTPTYLMDNGIKIENIYDFLLENMPK
jgi:predicted AAA+ superfamily ATPase